MSGTGTKSGSQERRKHTPENFMFGKLIGEGSFSTVFLVKEIGGNERELACKVCDKRQITKEKKTKYILSEKEILAKLNREWNARVPFFVRLYSTFQDSERLYFVMTYARNGDLLGFIDKLADSDIDCTQFYAAELVSAIEHLHSLGIIHRDLKPENILLNERMHILITDFGSAKQIETRADRQQRRRRRTGDNREEDSPERSSSDEENSGKINKDKSIGCKRLPDQFDDDEDTPPKPKRQSFVGTPQYVSPEILTACGSSRASDLWALGCIIFQMMTGQPPFQSSSEYLIFKKIQKLDYTFQEGFNEEAKDLIRRLLVIEPRERLGARDNVYYTSLREHSFFRGVDFEKLPDSTPSTLAPFLPSLQPNGEPEADACWSRMPANSRPGASGILRLMVENEGPDEDYELMPTHDLPPLGSSQNSSRSTTLTERPDNGLIEQDLTRDSNNSSTRINKTKKPNQSKVPKLYISEEERQKLLAHQEATNEYHRFVEGNLILKQGILNKKKGLLARTRMFLLTDGRLNSESDVQRIPHLYYVDPSQMVLKGEIPWSKCMKTEIRDPRIFFVHTFPPKGRVYYLLDPDSTAQEWCLAIEEVRQFFFDNI